MLEIQIRSGDFPAAQLLRHYAKFGEPSFQALIDSTQARAGGWRDTTWGFVKSGAVELSPAQTHRIYPDREVWRQEHPHCSAL